MVPIGVKGGKSIINSKSKKIIEFYSLGCFFCCRILWISNVSFEAWAWPLSKLTKVVVEIENLKSLQISAAWNPWKFLHLGKLSLNFKFLIKLLNFYNVKIPPPAPVSKYINETTTLNSNNDEVLVLRVSVTRSGL